MNRLGNLALIVATGLVIAYLASEAWSLWQSFQPLPAESRPHEPSDDLRRTPEQTGWIVFKAQGCLACHNLDLVGGALAPSLDNLGVRRGDANWLREKILNPHASVPGTYMPAFRHLSERELNGLVEFLKTLTPKRQSPDNTRTATIEIPKDEPGQPRFSMVQIERGKELFRAQGCLGCHTINGLYEGGIVGPNLTHEALRKRTDEWQLRHLIDPLSVYVVGDTPGVPWIMPSYRQLSEDDLWALVAFLQSLK